MIEGSIKTPDSYTITLGPDAQEYLRGFTEIVRLAGSYQKTPAVRECYTWCEKHLGAKYKDWYMIHSSIYFKNNKKATMFRLTWGHLIVSSQSSVDK